MLKLPYPLILASASPRRTEILSMAGIEHEVVPSLYSEPSHSDHLTEPETFALEVALGKGEEVFTRMDQKNFVLSADTLGIIDNIILEKPIDREDAKRMLELMSGETHSVLTAVALFSPDAPEEPKTKIVNTFVTFRELSEEEIEDYLDTEDYMDKAAAYAIQGKASIFVEKIEGDYFNVVGLPIVTVWGMLKSL